VAARPFPAGADVLLTPVLGTPAPPVGSLTGLRTLVGAGRAVPFTPPWNVSGHPAVSVPAGWTADGLPLAVQLVAPHGRDDLLLALARQLQGLDDWTARHPRLDP
ncbi:MAG: amiB2, partial [Frankiales bacterium]|nr:amiB2 [Frankiales bacterium]